MSGYRGYPRPFSPGAKKREKTNKKKDVRLKCTECKKSHVKKRTFRAKKFEVVKK
jgi:large subunit ribosomal protein L44e